MKPVAIFRHAETEGPGYFATFLDQRSIPWQLIAIDRGETVPQQADGYSGLCLMGGPMSVNDPLPWLDEMLNAVEHTNFFENRATEYSKASTGGTWEEAFAEGVFADAQPEGEIRL